MAATAGEMRREHHGSGPRRPLRRGPRPWCLDARREKARGGLRGGGRALSQCASGRSKGSRARRAGVQIRQARPPAF